MFEEEILLAYKVLMVVGAVIIIVQITTWIKERDELKWKY
jgi:hypothetical protein